eukprot:gene1103-698_t
MSSASSSSSSNVANVTTELDTSPTERQLVQVPSGDYSIVLHQGNNVVLYNEVDRVLVVDRANKKEKNRGNNNNEENSSRRNFLADVTRCPLCQHPISPQFAFMAQTYFRILQQLNTVHRPFSSAANNSNSGAHGLLDESVRNLPTGLLNNGYYSRFFREVSVLGSGSFGSVFRCIHHLEDMDLGEYAVKKIPIGDDRSWFRSVLREIKTCERLHHPNVVEYKHSWIELSRMSVLCPYVPFLFILMQFCNGGSLEDKIWPGNTYQKDENTGEVVRRRKQLGRADSHSNLLPTPLSDEDVWGYFVDIVSGIRYLHSVGIVHRDIKPSNILININSVGTEVCMISDFGISEPVDGGEFERRGGLRSGYTGTVEYSSPESVAGMEPICESSDMWSVGLVLYALCHSTLPYYNDDPKALKKLILGHQQSKIKSDLKSLFPPRPAVLHELIVALTALDPFVRPSADSILRHPEVQRRLSANAAAFSPSASSSRNQASSASPRDYSSGDFNHGGHGQRKNNHNNGYNQISEITYSSAHDVSTFGMPYRSIDQGNDSFAEAQLVLRPRVEDFDDGVPVLEMDGDQFTLREDLHTPD